MHILETGLMYPKPLGMGLGGLGGLGGLRGLGGGCLESRQGEGGWLPALWCCSEPLCLILSVLGETVPCYVNTIACCCQFMSCGPGAFRRCLLLGAWGLSQL